MTSVHSCPFMVLPAPGFLLHTPNFYRQHGIERRIFTGTVLVNGIASKPHTSFNKSIDAIVYRLTRRKPTDDEE
ncbi:MAG: hypothetical protein WBM27_04950 [bacterium]